jgi:hypothetical protein
VDYCRLRKTFRIGGSRRQVLLSSACGLDFLNFGELIGRPEFLKQRLIPDHPRANTLDLQILADLVAAVSNCQAPHSPEYGENSVPSEIPDAIKLLPDHHDARRALRKTPACPSGVPGRFARIRVIAVD